MTITFTMEATKENLEKLKKIFFEEPCTVTIVPPGTVSVTEPMPTEVEEPKKEEEAPAYTKTDVREAALRLSKADKREALRKIFKDHGGKSLSDFDGKPETYASLIKAMTEALDA